MLPIMNKLKGSPLVPHSTRKTAESIGEAEAVRLEGTVCCQVVR